MEKRNAKALLPIAVFVVLYLGLGILFEYFWWLLLEEHQQTVWHILFCH